MNTVELFSGAGGLGMGLSLSGFKPKAVVEWDKWACDTVRQNQERGFPYVADWNVYEGDVRQWVGEFCSNPAANAIDLVAGGPPCQPFSMGGKHAAFADSRDMFPVSVDVVRRLRPRAFIFENVKGLTRAAFHNYYHYILLQLEFPELVRKVDQSWREHLDSLQRHKSSNRETAELRYNVIPTLVNAANFGVPQKRERVFIVGFRSDLDVQWRFPWETHSQSALMFDQWVTGEYWDRHEISRKQRPSMPATLAERIDRMRGLAIAPTQRPWRTVRDALVGLPDPESHPRLAAEFHNHRFQAGAKIYPGHTGSALDLPAKTLKAGDHGVPGGENMLVRLDGSVRYFSIRESARLQTFPDGYVFHGSWTESMRQLGNAVPVLLAQTVAASVAEKLLENSSRTQSSQRRLVA
ncbi:MAG: DNA cytosine methyltransferase [Rhodocyclaceae bacterium]|jgi:DNA (cytosine-5)-methyltransferase 1|nr:DNA cytosine methyltransferase [Rhodocyclaceae bacterium]MCA3024441.1 DNA cytosine methyltransferase [Rhodocyclaceae bacterium]MCA3027086.1 DNA cytosine methyltransferase [Rhodocyclaceae bacterium]MCA3030556.1 DNA cytosine methyltransferase [Rhodocyclaceae bacterium]MCA3036833.1 DNA cytosine methyltransferase [Rhodocyclaceae bacterium]